MAGQTGGTLNPLHRRIALLAPALDLVLAAGERISRVAGTEDDYYPIRPPGEAFELAPAHPPGEPRAAGGDPA